MIPLKHFYMIRHGETEANAARLMAGSLDSPLTAKGRDQARKVHKVIETLTVKPTKIIHSHLTRARDTAAIINEALNVSMEEDPDFAEFHAGEWEGIPYDQCPDLLRGWVDPPGGETCENFFTRIKRAKIRALQGNQNPVMVVSHGGVFRAFLKLHAVDLEGVRNCILYEFEPKAQENVFPWNIWRYDIEDELVIRRPVNLENQAPDSEIAEEIA